MQPGYLKQKAIEMRQAPTAAEARFWSLVRGGRLGGMRFRRQHRIGDFIVDFACLKAKLIVELVGSAHDGPDARAHDDERYRYLEAAGFKVIELMNQEVLSMPFEVESKLVSELGERALPPKGGGGPAGVSSPVGEGASTGGDPSTPHG